MIIDTSAVIAILANEPEAEACARAIQGAERCSISAANYLEAGIIIDGRRSPVASRRLDEFLWEAGIRIEPVDPEQARIARSAYRDFGKGGGHPAQLNFADCFAYALAQSRREALLFKGGDFGHTDVVSALD